MLDKVKQLHSSAKPCRFINKRFKEEFYGWRRWEWTVRCQEVLREKEKRVNKSKQIRLKTPLSLIYAPSSPHAIRPIIIKRQASLSSSLKLLAFLLTYTLGASSTLAFSRRPIGKENWNNNKNKKYGVVSRSLLYLFGEE